MAAWAELWRDPRRAGLLMWAYFLLVAALGPLSYLSVSVRSGNGSVGPPSWPYGVASVAFLAWRVAGGGRISRMLLIIGTWGSCVATTLTIAHQFTPATFGRLAVFATQVALLLSPAVYLRTRPAGQARAAPAARFRLPPPLTLLLLAVFAGLCITVFGLTRISQPLAVSGCDRAAAPVILCSTVGEGAPLPWLTGYNGTLAVHWAAMAKDWTEFAVVSASVLYAGWLATGARWEPTEPAGIRFPLNEVVGCALGGLTLTVVSRGIPLTWLSAGQYEPLHNATPLLADAALWTLAGLCGYVALRVIGIRRSRRPNP